MNNDHGAKEMRLGLVVKLFLNSRVAYKDKRHMLQSLFHTISIKINVSNVHI